MMNRRRFLTIAGATAAAGPLPVLMSSSAQSSMPLQTWRGRALGAEARITLAADNAPAVMNRVRSELDRLDAIFSLFRSDSALTQLNQQGSLVEPPQEMLALLSLCDAVHRRTNGAFDPTVQSLWRLYGERAEHGTRPSAEEIGRTRERVGWHLVARSDAEVRLQDGAQLTLNGIAQGYIADRIADLLRLEGLNQVLIDTGEIYALGGRPDGEPWFVGLSEPNGAATARRRIRLQDSALAISEPHGTTIGGRDGAGHIIDPRSGLPSGRWHQVAVEAHTAALADGLSTAFAVMTRNEIDLAANGVDVILS